MDANDLNAIALIVIVWTLVAADFIYEHVKEYRKQGK